jgi:hypothetical protein
MVRAMAMPLGERQDVLLHAGREARIKVESPQGVSVAGACVTIVHPEWDGEVAFGEKEAYCATDRDGQCLVSLTPGSRVWIGVDAGGLGGFEGDFDADAILAVGDPLVLRLDPGDGGGTPREPGAEAPER